MRFTCMLVSNITCRSCYRPTERSPSSRVSTTHFPPAPHSPLQSAHTGETPSSHASRYSPEMDDTNRTAVPWVRNVVVGATLMRNPRYNKGLAFTPVERERLYLRGLIPPAFMSRAVQVERVMTNLREMTSVFEKHSYLNSLQVG